MFRIIFYVHMQILIVVAQKLFTNFFATKINKPSVTKYENTHGESSLKGWKHNRSYFGSSSFFSDLLSIGLICDPEKQTRNNYHFRDNVPTARKIETLTKRAVNIGI